MQAHYWSNFYNGTYFKEENQKLQTINNGNKMCCVVFINYIDPMTDQYKNIIAGSQIKNNSLLNKITSKKDILNKFVACLSLLCIFVLL